jgi:hypothetical protein
MSVGDIVLVDGSFAAARFSDGLRERVREALDAKKIRYSTGFFDVSAEAKGKADDDDLWDRSDEIAASLEASKKRAEARASGSGSGSASADDDIDIETV